MSNGWVEAVVGWGVCGRSATAVLTALFATVALNASPLPASADTATHDPGRTTYKAPKARRAPKVDGVANERVWQRAKWHPIDQRWLGPDYSPDDFRGRFKVVWTADKIYLLVEIVDDILFDSHRDPLVQYWDDDCLEIFVDEDNSGGNHQYNHNAFAYHMSLDNRAIDIGTDKAPHDYSDHTQSRWRANGNAIVWEVSIDIYDDGYVDGSDKNRPVALEAGKVIGLMLAWCDNDGSELRENFIGSESAPGEHKDRGWIDAGLFGSVVLVD
ncbi:MAG: sugar-binding protein [Myxococcota bacterium]